MISFKSLPKTSAWGGGSTRGATQLACGRMNREASQGKWFSSYRQVWFKSHNSVWPCLSSIIWEKTEQKLTKFITNRNRDDKEWAYEGLKDSRARALAEVGTLEVVAFKLEGGGGGHTKTCTKSVLGGWGKP